MKKNLYTEDKKFVHNGQVAILVSPGFGAGWSTWNRSQPGMLYDYFIVDLILGGVPDWQAKAEAYCELKYPGAYLGGLGDLQVQWVTQGEMFRVEEYDGSESVELRNQMSWQTA